MEQGVAPCGRGGRLLGRGPQAGPGARARRRRRRDHRGRRADSWPPWSTATTPSPSPGACPCWRDDDQSVLVELIAAEAGRIGALMSGDLPHPFVEAVEEAGVELLPYGGELGSACTCDAWLDPCPHALAVLTQLAWLIQRDPFVLFQLRGLARDEVLARLHALSQARPATRAADGDPATTTSTTRSTTWRSPRRPPCGRRATWPSCLLSWATRPRPWARWWRPGGRRAPRRGAAGRDRRP